VRIPRDFKWNGTWPLDRFVSLVIGGRKKCGMISLLLRGIKDGVPEKGKTVLNDHLRRELPYNGGLTWGEGAHA